MNKETNEKIKELDEDIRTLYGQLRLLKNEIMEIKQLEIEAVRRYEKQNKELLQYYIKYGILNEKELKK